MNKTKFFKAESIIEFISKQRDERFLDMNDLQGQDIGDLMIQYGRFVTHKPCFNAGFRSFVQGNTAYMMTPSEKSLNVEAVIRNCPLDIKTYGDLRKWMKKHNYTF